MEPKSSSRKGHSQLGIRPLGPADCSAIEKMVVSSGKFTAGEIATAMELVGEALEKGEPSGYFFAVLEEVGEKPSIHGYACYGPTPLTQGVYDLYWIVVDASAPIWNRHPSRSGCGRGGRIQNQEAIPPLALHSQLDGQIRLPRDPRSTLYNTDGQIFSDSGIPVVLFMENYDLHRQGYHDTHDTMENIDLDYGSALAAIAIEAVARAATEKPLLPRRGPK
jgi:hypothetical protein